MRPDAAGALRRLTARALAAPFGWVGRFIRPRHHIWPTRDGWWCLVAATGLGLAAVNTGNNLVYLLCSLILAIVVVSGILSEQTMRGLRLEPLLPEEVYAGRPVTLGAVLANRKRWLPSYSVAVAVLGERGPVTVLAVPRLGAGEERLLTWDATLPRRGRHRLPGVRMSTRFPFGLFVKSGRRALDADVVVFPAIRPVPPEIFDLAGGEGTVAARRRGRGHDLYDLRPYRPGDDPRLIHWRVSARTQTLTVRELEDDSAWDTRLVLRGTGAPDGDRLEDGLSRAGSIARELLLAGAQVELVGPGVFVPLGQGEDHLRVVLRTLALYVPPGPASAPVRGRRAGRGWLRTPGSRRSAVPAPGPAAAGAAPPSLTPGLREIGVELG